MFAPNARAPRVRVFTRLAASARRRWFVDRGLEFWLGELGSSWSASEIRARVVEVVDETAAARTFVLAPNRRWPGHRAGQYVSVEVEIDGVRTRRCYSITSPAGSRHIAITVARVPGGRMSTWLHEHLRAGDVVGLGAPRGDFVAPEHEAPLLLVAGGSGITPVIAIVRELEARGRLRDVVVVHSAHDDASAIFGRELAIMASQHAGLRVIAHRTAATPRLAPDALRARVPDLAGREIFACGPPGLIGAVEEAAGGRRIRAERFVAPAVRAATSGSVLVALRGRSVTLDGRGTLLEQLERAGERPAYGCRIGICQTCRCTKLRGTVVDLTTGRASDAPGDIRPCISTAGSDLELDL